MEIVEYDSADPAGVLQLNLLSLGWALTPEQVALIRRLDARPFPFFALYAVEDGCVAAQVAVYRLPMESVAGPEEVGGIAAVCGHPAFARRGLVAQLLEAAHDRLRAAGLRFSTLGTARHRGAYELYRRLGYEDLHVHASAFAPLEVVLAGAPGARLRAQATGRERLALAGGVFERLAAGKLGFARRPANFLETLVALGDLPPDDVCLLWDREGLAGYAVARNPGPTFLSISDLALLDPSRAADAAGALARARPAAYVQVRVSGPAQSASLRQAGYPPARPDWGTFMVKPLLPGLSLADARRCFDVGSDRCRLSWLDTT